MLDVKSKIAITVKTSQVIPFVTEPKTKTVATITNQAGDTHDLKAHQVQKDLIKFLEQSGLTVEQREIQEGFRGKTILCGIPVKISPIKHTNYDGGVIIKVDEVDATSFVNSRKIVKFLRKNEIDVKRYCEVSVGGTSCVAVLDSE